MKKGIVALLLAGVLALAGCGRGAPPAAGGDAQDTAAITVITAEEGKDKIDAGGVTVVDVRTAEEYEEGHVPGALLVPNEEIAGTPPELLPDLDAPLLVYCRSGRRSAEAAQKLTDMGYTAVFDMGGIIDWPYETESGAFGS